MELSTSIILLLLLAISYYTASKVHNYLFPKLADHYSLTITISLYLFSIVLIYILFFYDLTAIEIKLFKTNTDGLMYILVYINVLVYVITPLIYFYVKNEVEKQSNICILSEALPIYDSVKDWFRRYLNYLFLFAILNGMYLYYFNVLSVDRYRDLLKFSRVPKVLQKYSKLETSLEILTYFNFGMIISLGKLFMVTYIPFGMARSVAFLIDTLKENDFIIRKFFPSTQTTGFFKIYFTMANFFFLTLSVVLTLTLIYTKVILLVSKLSSNICGNDCGLLSFRYDQNISFEYILFEIVRNADTWIMSVLHLSLFITMMLFRIVSIIVALYYKGIAFLVFNIFNFQLISKDWMLNFVFYFFLLWGNIILFYDMTYVAPDYVRFYTLSNKCDFLQIDSPDCGLSFYGLFYIKLSLNFIGFIYLDLVVSVVFILTSCIWLYVFVGKSLKSFFTTNIAAPPLPSQLSNEEKERLKYGLHTNSD